MRNRWRRRGLGGVWLWVALAVAVGAAALFDRCAARLEHGFDFMEGAFGNSQEMAVFVTGLNTSRCSTDFLRQYSCERYFQYNRMLLFDDREQEILSRIPE